MVLWRGRVRVHQVLVRQRREEATLEDLVRGREALSGSQPHQQARVAIGGTSSAMTSKVLFQSRRTATMGICATGCSTHPTSAPSQPPVPT